MTGATSGVGLALARELVQRGATVVVTGRSQAKCERAAEWAQEQGGAGGRAVPLAAELSNLASARALAGRVMGLFGSVDLLFLNAGMSYGASSGSRGAPQRGPQGHDVLFASNCLGQWLLCQLLLPALERSALPACVVLTSSVLAYHGQHDLAALTRPRAFEGGGLAALAAYADSKLAAVLFGAELGRRLAAEGSKVRVRAVAPGMVATSLSVRGAARDAFAAPSSPPASRWWRQRFSAAEGAKFTLAAAFSPGNHVLYGPYHLPGLICWGPRLALVGWLIENVQRLLAGPPGSLVPWPEHPLLGDRAFCDALWREWSNALK